ncbi:hypothetical protein HanPSC8_Chr07g0270141 [Helianthus annuus]|nr:hypothetical protein HanPSC8_Chr07g0270141 [Helianthus annuus]
MQLTNIKMIVGLMPIESTNCGGSHPFPDFIETHFIIVNSFHITVPPSTATCICS